MTVQPIVRFAAAALLALAGGYRAAGSRERRSRPGTVLLATRLNDLDGAPQPMEQWRGQGPGGQFLGHLVRRRAGKEIPEFIRLQERYGARGLQFVGIAIDQPGRSRDSRANIGINYPLLMAGAEAWISPGKPATGWAVLPFTVVIDREEGWRSDRAGRSRREELVQPLSTCCL